MYLSERQSNVLLSLHRAKIAGFQWRTTRSIAAALHLNMSQAGAAISNLRGKGLATQPGVQRYSISQAGVKRAEKIEGEADD